MSDLISTTSRVKDDLILDAVTTWGNVNLDVCQSSEKQNILSGNDFLHSLKFPQEESHGNYDDDSCQTHPKEIDFFPPSAIINTQVNSENNNIQTARPNSAHSFNNVSIHINGDYNIINTKATPSIDPSKPQNGSLSSIEKKVLTVKKGLVPPKVLFVVAEEIGIDWRKLGLNLDFSLHDLDTLYHDHHFEGAVEICHRLLASWRERLGSAATYLTLANALKNIRKLDVIKKCLLTSAE